MPRTVAGTEELISTPMADIKLNSWFPAQAQTILSQNRINFQETQLYRL